MAKSFILITLSLALSFSMLAPALNSLLDFNPDYTSIGDFSEEESNKNEKEIFEKDIVFLGSHKIEPYYISLCGELSGFYMEDSSMFDEKILLPPPKHTS